MDRVTSAVALVGAALLATSLPGAVIAQDVEVTPEGTGWSLTEYTAAGALTAVPSGVSASLLLEDGQATGSGGCNSFFGTYTIDGSAISFSEELGQTLKLCEGDAQAVEDAYLATLPSVASWSIEEGSLRLADDGGTPLLVYGGTSEDIVAGDTGSILAALALLTRQVAALDARISTLEDGDGAATEPEKPKPPKAPRAGKVKTQLPDWMRDEFRPESERSDEKNRETATWRDRATDETGFNVYARRGYCQLKPDADTSQELTDKDFRKARDEAVLIETLAPDTTSYVPDHAAIDAALPAAPESPYSNDQFYDLLISAFNDVGESKPAKVASYFLTPEFNCP